MLTAVNVARSCRMVNAKERVLFVHAAPPRGWDEPAALRFVPYEHHLEQPDASPSLPKLPLWAAWHIKCPRGFQGGGMPCRF